MCAAISQNGVVHHHATIGPYNSAHMIAFLDTLHDILTVQRPEQTRYVIIWDNVSFHRAALVRNWFTDHPLFMALNLPPYSPFLNPIEEFFSAWRWKVHDRHPHQHAALLQAMEEACGDIEQASCQAWIRHARRYFPRCLGLEDIACDVDEILWPDPERRHDNWFQQHPHFTVLYLPPYSPFLNPIEEFFSAWQWKVYDLRLQAEVPLIQAMEEACDQMEVPAMQGWIRHSRRFFPRCLANDSDVDEILWPDPARRRDV
ncbi:hypothetical protein N1851_022889 [Merluccius polli]|uniref:Tc1-like transposase DDE domain-containing protein n=1 Tax=Merluccius polli TaxID=89951 RepID=A0AA47NVI1_MERPO|nr:hypothetical protein N1851_022889 [Merluccius polli]